MNPTSTAVAPSDASSGPVIERAPSYTMSAVILTNPKPTTARHGDQRTEAGASPTVAALASVSAGWVIGLPVRPQRRRQREPARIRPDRF